MGVYTLLKVEPTEYLGLRDYQLAAIRAVEAAIERGQRECLVAMATGTGKTRTCIGLTYRLLKTRRFRRVLFLVDRSALGEQTANAYKDARLESLQTFADIFGMKELADIKPDPDTKLQIATIQGMVKRILFPSDEGDVPPVDQYDFPDRHVELVRRRRDPAQKVDLSGSAPRILNKSAAVS